MLLTAAAMLDSEVGVANEVSQTFQSRNSNLGGPFQFNWTGSSSLWRVLTSLRKHPRFFRVCSWNKVNLSFQVMSLSEGRKPQRHEALRLHRGDCDITGHWNVLWFLLTLFSTLIRCTLGPIMNTDLNFHVLWISPAPGCDVTGQLQLCIRRSGKRWRSYSVVFWRSVPQNFIKASGNGQLWTKWHDAPALNYFGLTTIKYHN